MCTILCFVSQKLASFCSLSTKFLYSKLGLFFGLKTTLTVTYSLITHDHGVRPAAYHSAFDVQTDVLSKAQG